MWGLPSLGDILTLHALSCHIIHKLDIAKKASTAYGSLENEVSSLILSRKSTIHPKDPYLIDSLESILRHCRQDLEQQRLIIDRLDVVPLSGVWRKRKTLWNDLRSRILNHLDLALSRVSLIAMSASITDRMLLIPKICQRREFNIVPEKTQWHDNAWEASFSVFIARYDKTLLQCLRSINMTEIEAFDAMDRCTRAARSMA